MLGALDQAYASLTYRSGEAYVFQLAQPQITQWRLNINVHNVHLSDLPDDIDPSLPYYVFKGRPPTSGAVRVGRGDLRRGIFPTCSAVFIDRQRRPHARPDDLINFDCFLPCDPAPARQSGEAHRDQHTPGALETGTHSRTTALDGSCKPRATRADSAGRLLSGDGRCRCRDAGLHDAGAAAGRSA